MSLLMIVLVNMTSTSMYAQEKSLPFEGRWNMVIYQEGAELPSWLEMRPWGYTMVGRRVTVEANGSIIINDQTLPGITGGAMNGKENEPGPFMLQGDHYPIEYRNIIVTPRVSRSKK